MYLNGILWLITWPAMILASWYLIRFFLKKTEHHLPENED